MAPLPTGKLPPEMLADLLNRHVAPDPLVLAGPGIGIDAAILDLGDRCLVAKTDPIKFLTRPQPRLRVVGFGHRNGNVTERKRNPTHSVTTCDARFAISPPAEGFVESTASHDPDSQKPLAGSGVQCMHNQRPGQILIWIQELLEEIRHLSRSPTGGTAATARAEGVNVKQPIDSITRAVLALHRRLRFAAVRWATATYQNSERHGVRSKSRQCPMLRHQSAPI